MLSTASSSYLTMAADLHMTLQAISPVNLQDQQCAWVVEWILCTLYGQLSITRPAFFLLSVMSS